MTVKKIARGIYRDLLYNTRNARLIDFGWRNNIIVNECRSLIASLMKGGSASGINRIEFGRGDPLWDDESRIVPTPTAETNRLVDTAFVDIAIDPSNIVYLNANGEVSANNLPTNIIEVSVSLPAGTLARAGEVYPLREFALFGEVTTDQTSEKYMVDYVRHGLINIDSDHELTRKIRLIF